MRHNFTRSSKFSYVPSFFSARWKRWWEWRNNEWIHFRGNHWILFEIYKNVTDIIIENFLLFDDDCVPCIGNGVLLFATPTNLNYSHIAKHGIADEPYVLTFIHGFFFFFYWVVLADNTTKLLMLKFQPYFPPLFL